MALFPLATSTSTLFAIHYLLPLLLGLLRCVYRLTLHPLAKVPGPFLDRISSWPDFLAAASGDRHVRLWQLHEIYGPVVRIAPNRVSFNTVGAYKAIYDGKANVKNGLLHRTFIASNRGRVDILSAEREVHSRKRKIISRAFSEKALRMNEPAILENQRIWLEQVAKSDGDDAWSEPADMSRWLPYLTVDTVGEIGFSRHFGTTRHGRFRHLPQMFAGLVATNFKFGHTPPLLQSLLNALFKFPIMSLFIPLEAQKFDKFTDDLIAERVAQELNQQKSANNDEPELRDDFVRLFRDHEGNLSKAGVEEIKTEATTLLIAGSDTVATALSGVLFYLTHSPRCLARATAEIRSLFSTVEDIKRGPELSCARYLRACIDESLRLSPSVPGYLPREVLPGGITIEGQDLPAGIEVGVPAYALHLNPEYYPRPFEYWPERWLEDTANDSNISKRGDFKVDGAENNESTAPAQDPALARAAFAAFSAGSHSCAGKELAYMEMTLLLARILYLYDIKLAEDETKRHVGEGQGPKGQWGRRMRGQYQIRDYFTGRSDGPWIQFRRRE